MQRDRDSEICLIHFTLIHRLALPDTTTSLTVMLLCMIAPGLDSSITAVSVRFFPLEASLIDSPWTHQSLPGTLLTTADSQTAGTFGASPVGLLPGAYISMLTMLRIRSQPMFACHKDAVCHKCRLYPSVGLRLTNSFASFKTVFNVFSQNKVLLWVGSQDAKGEF